jgi:hypothetical protein
MLHQCLPNEDVVRALRSSDWDTKHNRFSSNLFTGPNTSVSRLQIFSLKRLFKIFHHDLDRFEKIPPWIVKWAGEINIGKLELIGKNFKDKPTHIIVKPDPLRHNKAHAIIPNKLSRGLANGIIKELKIHNDSTSDFYIIWLRIKLVIRNIKNRVISLFLNNS